MAPFLAMAKLKQAWLCSSGLTKTFYFIAPFLAMAKLKQAWLCSSGLTKTFFFKDNRDNRDNFLYVVFRAQPWHT